MLVKVLTDKSPKAIGPYSQAIKIENMVYTSGQLGMDPLTGKIESDTIEKETEIALNNLENILKESGSSKDNVIKTTIFIKNIDDFDKINRVYEKFFANHKPARSCVEVSRLPKDGNIEIEAIAII